MKRLAALALAIALCASMLAYAADAEPITLVSFDNLKELVVLSSEKYQSSAQQLRKLEITLADLQDQHESVMKDSSSAWTTAPGIQDSMKKVKESIDDLSGTMPDIADQLTFAAEQMYIGYFALAKEADIAARALAALEQDLPAQKQKRELGLISQSTLDTYEKSIKTARDKVKSTKTACSDNLKTFARYLGIGNQICLDGMPGFDSSRITNRDLEADKAAYRLSAPSVVEKENALKTAQETYSKSLSASDSYSAGLAKTELAKARDNAETDFPGVYEKLYDSYTDYITSAAVADALAALDKAITQYNSGIISKSKLTTAQRDYQTALDRHEQQGIQLYLDLLTYEYNLIKW